MWKLKISSFHCLNLDSLFEGGTVILVNCLPQFSGLLTFHHSDFSFISKPLARICLTNATNYQITYKYFLLYCHFWLATRPQGTLPPWYLQGPGKSECGRMEAQVEGAKPTVCK